MVRPGWRASASLPGLRLSGNRDVNRHISCVAAACLVFILAGLNAASAAILMVSVGGQTVSYTTGQLLSRSDVTTITIDKDLSYPGSMTYTVVPLAAVIGPLGMKAADTLQVQALDGYVAELPGDSVLNVSRSKPIAYLAIESPASPWPNLPGQSSSAGPFVIVWTGPNAVRQQWPYQIASLTEAPPAVQRWPQLAVGPEIGTKDPIRHGQTLFVSYCFVCHQLSGAGASNIGPDLGLPMPATQYFQPAALAKLIRDPALVRDWPGRRMPPFPKSILSDRDISDIIAYLTYKAGGAGQ
ncbi:cytochrome c [Rhizobiales bacterium Sp-1]|uniref:Cytochrome c n=1 Tax=Segnochrobactrum spirostomi TaxID=2608987 RepID=A0A6A7Y9J9_9HYPH|nr:cytochrome c [Segnochrobactrum spirostomi]